MINDYKKLNSSFKTKMIFHFGHDAGFYSELNNMILAIIYCLQNEIEFRIYSKDAKFCVEKGWEDFFLPFCIESKNSFHKYFHRRELICDNNKFNFIIKKIAIYIYKILSPNTYLTSDFWAEFHSRKMEDLKYTFPTLGIFNEDLQSTSKIIISFVYKFNMETRNKIDKLVKSINLPEHYVGFQIRRGDKILEFNEFPNESYIKKSIQICENIRNAFILTDDYRVIEDINHNFKDWIFFTLTNVDEKGYEFFDSIGKSDCDRRSDMIKLFASIEIIRRSDFFVGTFSANPGMFLGMCMDKNKTFGIDLDKWQIW